MTQQVVKEHEGTRLADQAEAIASLPADLAILKLENDTITSLSAAHPRNYEVIKADIAATFDAFPELAEEAIYSKPVGKDDKGVQKFARNLSIRTAETIAEAYGFNRVRCDVTDLGEAGAKVEATFTDYQRGRIWQDSAIVSRYYKKSGSNQMVRHNDDRFWNVIVKAAKSIQIREVILRSVNAGLKAWLFAEAEKRTDQLLTDGAVNKIVASFADRGVRAEQLEEFVGRARSQGWLIADRRRLAEVWNAIEQEETTVAEVFGGEPAPTPPAAADKLSGALGGATATAEAKVEKPDTEKSMDPEAKRKATNSEIVQASNLLGREKFDKIMKEHGATVKDLPKYSQIKLDEILASLYKASE